MAAKRIYHPETTSTTTLQLPIPKANKTPNFRSSNNLSINFSKKRQIFLSSPRSLAVSGGHSLNQQPNSPKPIKLPKFPTKQITSIIFKKLQIIPLRTRLLQNNGLMGLRGKHPCTHTQWQHKHKIPSLGNSQICKIIRVRSRP